MEYDNRNSGVAFTNDYKQTEKHPDFKGKGNYEGLEFEVALWERKDKQGRTFYSMKFSEPFRKEVNAEPTKPEQSFTVKETEDPLPF